MSTDNHHSASNLLAELICPLPGTSARASEDGAQQDTGDHQLLTSTRQGHPLQTPECRRAQWSHESQVRRRACSEKELGEMEPQ